MRRALIAKICKKHGARLLPFSVHVIARNVVLLKYNRPITAAYLRRYVTTRPGDVPSRLTSKTKSERHAILGCQLTLAEMRAFRDVDGYSPTKSEAAFHEVVESLQGADGGNGKGFRSLCVLIASKKDYEMIARHELSHALFANSREYRVRSLKIVNSLPRATREVMDRLIRKLNYEQARAPDEIQAYLLDGLDDIAMEVNIKSRKIRADIRAAHALMMDLFLEFSTLYFGDGGKFLTPKHRR